MTGPEAISATELAINAKVSQSSLSRWLRDARTIGLETFFKSDRCWWCSIQTEEWANHRSQKPPPEAPSALRP